MITKKKLRWEVARLSATNGYLSFVKDMLTADNEALLRERDELRETVSGLKADNQALLDTVAALCDKNKELQATIKDQRLKIMSYEAIWEAQKRRRKDDSAA